MTLTIDDPQAAELARKLADRRGQTVEDAVTEALRNELKREQEQRPLYDRLKEISDRLLAKSKGEGREVTKEDMDRMWGHE